MMLIHELNSTECVAILQRTTLGHLGCSDDDQPYVVPIYFAYDTDLHCAYGFSLIGQKVNWMRKNPKICLAVEEVEDKNHWRTVLIVGRYMEIQDEPLEAEARRRAERLFQERHEWWLPAAGNVPSKRREDAVLFRIAIDRLTGRKADRREHRDWF
jgi:nitroimidazol reductase NimA-like FMN-containing flavoprotein (pyridoxamine 5'-phosphate oxidase superfamily)